MTVLKLNEPSATLYSAFGNTPEQAKSAASAMAKKLTEAGHYVTYDNFVNKCRDGVYSIGLLAKKRYYK